MSTIRILKSRLLKFTVGSPSPSTYQVHEAAISQLSTLLYALTKVGPVGTYGTVTWKDVSSDTFERFSQFAYTGDYSIPASRERAIEEKDKKEKANGFSNGVKSPAVGAGTDEGNTSVVSTEGEGRDRSGSGVGLLSDREVVLEAGDEDPGSILNYPTISKNTLKNKKKKKGKAVSKLPEPELESLLETAKLTSELELQQETTSQLEAEPLEWSTNGERNHPEPTPVSSPTTVHNLPEQHIHLPAPSTDFKNLSIALLAPLNPYANTVSPSTTFERTHSYTPIFLAHASLYKLADRFVIESLKALTLWKLHRSLCVFELLSGDGKGAYGNANVEDVVALARYAYSSSPSQVGDDRVENGSGLQREEMTNGAERKVADGSGNGSESEGLKALVCQYMALHAVELSRDGGFMNLLAGGGQIVRDFFWVQLQLGRMG